MQGYTKTAITAWVRDKIVTLCQGISKIEDRPGRNYIWKVPRTKFRNLSTAKREERHTEGESYPLNSLPWMWRQRSHSGALCCSTSLSPVTFWPHTGTVHGVRCLLKKRFYPTTYSKPSAETSAILDYQATTLKWKMSLKKEKKGGLCLLSFLSFNFIFILNQYYQKREKARRHDFRERLLFLTALVA